MKVFTNLIEISGKNIDEAGLRALGRLNGSCLSSISFELIILDQDERSLDKAIDFFCKGCPLLKKLWFIDSSKWRITDAAVLSVVKHCPHIEELSIRSWNGVTDLSMAYLTHLSCLRVIDLTSCSKLTSAGVQVFLKANQKLEVLVPSDVSEAGYYVPPVSFFDDALLRCIGLHCPSLVKLCMQFDVGLLLVWDVTAASFDAMLKGLPWLEEFRACYLTNESAVLHLLGIYCPRLKHVYIDNIVCKDDDVVSMCQGCPLLESLHFSLLRDLSDAAMHALASSCHLLRKLYLSSNDHITDDSLCTLFSNCIHFESVSLTALDLITDMSILALLKCCPKLRDLTLDGCSRLTDDCFLAVPVHCPRIGYLELTGLVNLSHEAVLQISKHCKQLRSFAVQSCQQITSETTVALIGNCQRLSCVIIESKNKYNIQINGIEIQYHHITAKRGYGEELCITHSPEYFGGI